MVNLRKVSREHPVKHNLVIDYLLTFRCNYDCSYCISHDINHPTLKRSVDEIIEGLEFLLKNYPEKTSKIYLLGGEPFVYKDFIPLLNELSYLSQVTAITNLSVSKKVLNNIKVSNNISLTASYHPEFSDCEEFVEKVKYLQEKGIEVKASVSVHPEEKYLKSILYVLENIDKNCYPKYLSIMPNNSEIFSKSYEYSEKIKSSIKKFDNSKQSFKNLVYEYDDGTVKINSISEIVINNLDNFKGMKCKAGHDKLHIDEKGDIFPSACLLNTKTVLGNIFKKTFKLPNNYITCPFTFCKCTSDLTLEKFKN